MVWTRRGEAPLAPASVRRRSGKFVAAGAEEPIAFAPEVFVLVLGAGEGHPLAGLPETFRAPVDAAHAERLLRSGGLALGVAMGAGRDEIAASIEDLRRYRPQLSVIAAGEPSQLAGLDWRLGAHLLSAREPSELVAIAERVCAYHDGMLAHAARWARATRLSAREHEALVHLLNGVPLKRLGDVMGARRQSVPLRGIAMKFELATIEEVLELVRDGSMAPSARG